MVITTDRQHAGFQKEKMSDDCGSDLPGPARCELTGGRGRCCCPPPMATTSKSTKQSFSLSTRVTVEFCSAKTTLVVVPMVMTAAWQVWFTLHIAGPVKQFSQRSLEVQTRSKGSKSQAGQDPDCHSRCTYQNDCR